MGGWSVLDVAAASKFVRSTWSTHKTAARHGVALNEEEFTSQKDGPR
jgi:hypothetical protein